MRHHEKFRSNENYAIRRFIDFFSIREE